VKRALIVGIVVILVLGSFGLFGFANEQVYFSIHYEVDGIVKKIKVTESKLVPNWWDLESRHKFTEGKNLWERAQDIQEKKVLDPAMTLQKKFPEIYKIVKNIEDEVFKAKNDGIINFEPDRLKKFWITDQEEGRELDVKKLCMDIFMALKGGVYTDIYADVKVTTPRGVDDILDDIVERSRYSTVFADNAPRESNIALALEAFDGLIVKDGERVSFNKVVGPRTSAMGFEEANIIKDGEFVPGIGGGVCQASTTIFNAVLLSGLRIAESHNHSLPISYVPLGRDAMVSSAADLEFVNNTGHTIFIEAKVIDNGPKNTALVKIYGAPTSFRYVPRVEMKTLEQKYEILGEVPVETSGYDFYTGEEWYYKERVIESGYPPRETITYLDTYRDDEIVRSKIIRKSHYKGKQRIVKYEKVYLSPISNGM